MKPIPNDPCEGCPAPCCHAQQIPHIKLEYAAMVDWTRYFMLFPGTEFVIRADGTTCFIRWQTCSLFLSDSCKCSVHGTAKQPFICASYTSRDCWFKRNFVTDDPVDACRLNPERFDRWSAAIRYDKTGRVTYMPDFTETVALIRDVPISPRFETDTRLVKTLCEA